MPKNNIITLLVITIIASNIVGGYSSDLPSDIQKCKSSDNDACISKAITDILHRYPNGNPEFGLPNVSAITQYNTTISESKGDSPIQINFKFNKFVVLGLENATVLHALGFDKEFKKPATVEALVPSLRIQGDFESSGKILILPLNGKGKGDIELKDAFFKIKSKLKLEKRNGKTYLKIKHLKAVLKPKQMIVNMANIINDNPTLTESINSVVNENWREVWMEMESGINNSIEQLVIKLVGDVINELSLDDFYID